MSQALDFLFFCSRSPELGETARDDAKVHSVWVQGFRDMRVQGLGKVVRLEREVCSE